MKRAEQIAWAALGGLVVIAVILLSGGILFHMTAFWAGTMLATGQALVVAIAAWGLMLARQARELGEMPSVSDMGFRMNRGDDAPAPANVARAKLSAQGDAGQAEREELKTLDTGFQRIVVGGAGALLVVLSAVTAYLVYAAYAWGRANPDKAMPIVGPFADATDAMTGPAAGLNSLGVLIGLSAAGIYGVIYWLTRREKGRESEAVRGCFSLGIGGAAALAIATVLAFFQVSYASELAAGVMAFVMGLGGLELIVNSMRSYSGIEELDEEAVDLQQAPLVPMMGSVWMSGLRLLFAQSVGLSGKERRERGVAARMMPRVLVAVAVLAIGISCLKVVQPGQVAVLERLGWAPTDKDGRVLPEGLLQPGLHLQLPWPMDQLVYIPTQQLQETNVGTELHAPKEWKNVDFQFWTFRPEANENDQDDLFMTGDTPPQLLETYIQVRWRVADPAQFYHAMSHSDFFDKSKGQTSALPIYAAMVQQCTSYAVTRTFEIHSLDQIMIADREEVEAHCRQILQDKLDTLGSGIEVVYLTIKDLHPPFSHLPRPDPTREAIGGTIIATDKGISINEDDPQNPAKVARGPASAFEFVNSMREFRQELIDLANGEATAKKNEANGFAAQQLAEAEAYRLDKIAQAHGDADRLLKMTENMDPKEEQFQLRLMEQQLLFATVKGLLSPVYKVIVDPSVKDLEIWQTTPNGPVPVRPAGP